jgi:hypothetical protein
MVKSFYLLGIALSVTHTSPALAERDFQHWLTVSAKADIGAPVALQADVIARFGDAANGLYELENAFLVGYKLGDRTTAWAGYVHNPTYNDDEFVVLERRAREQITVEKFTQLGAASLSARLRFEQRWRDGIQGTGWRVRPYLKAEIPLGDETLPVLNFTAEPYFNLNTTSFQAAAGFERLRSAVSLGIQLADAVKLEAGYLNQHRFVRGGEDLGDHALTASLALSF